jgi:hypothetical protein
MLENRSGLAKIAVVKINTATIAKTAGRMRHFERLM